MRELRLLVLPGSGKGLKYRHGDLEQFEAELTAAGMTREDLFKQAALATTRYVQLGRAWEETISLDDARALVDEAKGEGVTPDQLLLAMVKTAQGRAVKITPLFDPDVAEEATAPVSTTPATEAAPSKNAPGLVALGRAS